MQTDPTISLRPTTIHDLSFLREMVYEAIHWADGDRPSIDETLARPAIAMLTDGWGREGDWGLVAEADDGTPIGAAWCRSWTADHHAFGYVADDIPEVSIALARGQRERGLGTMLLQALLNLARTNGLAKLSLAVEQTNLRAQHVYENLGFTRVETTAEDYIMVVNL
ncbi:MAG: GNAT family N-acetyltransferase [Chloroflexi bacterium]|nr:GNAT family N-acetyltransferase [Chloroflexota bacterium]MDA1173833.1 GNAT family N-acetyltransferase [Chloroflexota bacterium]